MPKSKLGQSSLTVRCSEKEHRIISQKAQELGLGLSEYVRLVCLNTKVEVNVKEEGKC